MKHFLFLTWKDIEHPHAGGAERVMYEYASRLVADGHRVTWFASRFPGASPTKTLDGIELIRRYSLATIPLFAWHWYRIFKKTHPIDVIIDEAGGIPLLSPLYEKTIPIYFFIHHIPSGEFDTIGFFPLSLIARRLFHWMLARYADIPTLTVSLSTKKELEDDFGFTRVSVVENACHIPPLSAEETLCKSPEIIFLGRLTRVKRVEDAIAAFTLIHRQYPEYILRIVGESQDAAYRQSLSRLIAHHGLTRAVHFHHYTPELREKYLRRATLMLVTSKKEGFGLVVLEANSFGVPVIAYRVAGLQDSVQDGINGFLVEAGNVVSMAERAISLLSDVKYAQDMAKSALEHRRARASWDDQYTRFFHIISQGYAGTRFDYHTNIQ